MTLLLLGALVTVQAVRPLPQNEFIPTYDTGHTFAGGAPELPWPGEGQAAVDVEGIGVMGVRGEGRPRPIASVAKTMTAYVILREHPVEGDEEGARIEVDRRAEEQSHAADESTVPLTAGQTFTEKQLLQLLMIPSGNNVARLLARWDAGSEDAFVRKMNDAARELGMTESTYTDPSGLDPATVSTSLDQLKLAKAALRSPVLQEIVDTPQIEVPGVTGTIYNNNRALLEPGVDGVKTGSSTPAGGNLLWSARTVVDGRSHRIVGAVFGIRSGGTLHQKLQKAIDDSATLIRAARSAIRSETVIEEGEVVGYVHDGLGGRAPVVAVDELKGSGWAGLRTRIGLTGAVALPRSAPDGTLVGKAVAGEGTGSTSVPLALRGTMEEPGLLKRLLRLW
ncbi:D-alanyl-D-alanine carboxypeptidase [Streptomyces sp. CB02009]|uniref:D-alanyl-D-alanine carboxypeptidase family protein n=1 Tax=Streptomyces sp. CB02009 TaxID=1703938 RepID=UPI00093F2EC0|nr:D-alanyl-D-alanine carboxypeptidase [Streptomyces sp. CB02009]OKJ49514.1 D-alanyl-D-alanine carboxypeptidase [Streptomyces sp. CB02009]